MVNKHDGEDYVNPHRRFYFIFNLKILSVDNSSKHELLFHLPLPACLSFLYLKEK